MVFKIPDFNARTPIREAVYERPDRSWSCGVVLDRHHERRMTFAGTGRRREGECCGDRGRFSAVGYGRRDALTSTGAGYDLTSLMLSLPARSIFQRPFELDGDHGTVDSSGCED